MAFDTLKESIEAVKRKMDVIHGRIKQCKSLPQTDGLRNQIMIWNYSLEAELMTLEKLEHRMEKRDGK